MMTRRSWRTLRHMYVSRMEDWAQKKTPTNASVRVLGRGPTANISRKLPHWGKSCKQIDSPGLHPSIY